MILILMEILLLIVTVAERVIEFPRPHRSSFTSSPMGMHTKRKNVKMIFKKKG